MTVVVKVVNVGSSVGGMLNKSQRLLLGLFVLLLVDVIWVSSSELTKVMRTLLVCCVFVMFFTLALNANYSTNCT
jgi:preprotein translocase subunit SecE